MTKKLYLNEVGLLEGNIPPKIPYRTFYPNVGDIGALMLIFLVLIIQSVIRLAIAVYYTLNYTTSQIEKLDCFYYKLY